MPIVVGQVVAIGDPTDVRVVLGTEHSDSRVGRWVNNRRGAPEGLPGLGAFSFPLEAQGALGGSSYSLSDPGFGLSPIVKRFIVGKRCLGS